MDEWIANQIILIKVARDKQLLTDHHALVEYDPNITEYPVHSYVLFTPAVGRSDKFLPSVTSQLILYYCTYYSNMYCAPYVL
jgi:hypothetical protein